MRKMVLLSVCLLLFLVAGCDRLGLRSSPETVTKAHVEQILSGLGADASGLKFTIVESGDGSAVVQVSGSVAVHTAVRLVQQNKQWVVATAEAPAEAAPAKPSGH
jgi:hypothetical protein